MNVGNPAPVLHTTIDADRGIEMTDAFIASTHDPVIYLGPASRGLIARCRVLSLGLPPRPFRRRRLRWLQPLAARCSATKRFWDFQA